MNKLRLFLLLILINNLFLSCKNSVSQYSADLTVHFEFPDSTKTLFAKELAIDVPARIGIYFPENYTTNKDFPLILWLNGGNGGPGINMRIPKEVTQYNDYICVNFPLFKTSLDTVKSNFSTYWSRIKYRQEKVDIIWNQYEVYLSKLFEVIPNIDTSNTFMGGFSNGAHTTAILLDLKKAEIQKYFKNFFLIEGGEHMKEPSNLKGHNFLVIKGGENKRKQFREVFELAQKAGANATFYSMKNTGHAFPNEYHYVLKDWMDNCIENQQNDISRIP